MCVSVEEIFPCARPGRLILCFTQLNRLNIEGLWSGPLHCTHAGDTAYILKYVDSSPRSGGPAFGRGLLGGLDGVHGSAFVPCMLCEIGVMSWGVTPL